MLCEGSLATKNVGMLVKEVTKPMKDFQERKETMQELHDKKEFQADEDEPIEGEEDEDEEEEEEERDSFDRLLVRSLNCRSPSNPLGGLHICWC